jgi:FAD/FMN-containing dehydrogenase
MLSDLTRSGAQLLAAEYVDQRTLQRVMEHSGLPHLLDPVPPLTLFIEIAGLDFGWQPDERARLAQDSPSKRALWAYREQASDSWTAAGEIRKLDVSLPLPAFANFAAELTKLLNDAATVTDHGSFGHLADGNLHIEVLGPGPTDTSIDRAVLELVTHFGGSISAEHGIGRAKAEFLSLAHDPSSLELMRSVKRTFDPQGILNPGVIFPEAH